MQVRDKITAETHRRQLKIKTRIILNLLFFQQTHYYIILQKCHVGNSAVRVSY